MREEKNAGYQEDLRGDLCEGREEMEERVVSLGVVSTDKQFRNDLCTDLRGQGMGLLKGFQQRPGKTVRNI